MNSAERTLVEGCFRRHHPEKWAPEAQAQAVTQYQFTRLCDSLLSLPSRTRRTAGKIPPTSPERLAQAAATDDNNYDSPDVGSGTEAHGNASPPTVLYLAYGSNLSAETFLGARGIQPLSATNVSAPAFDLAFDLPGIPYQEPCFANVAPRRIPKPKHPLPAPPSPPKIPPVLPSPPAGDPTRPPPPPPSYAPAAAAGGVGIYKYDADEKKGEQEEEEAARGTGTGAGTGEGPTWPKGLYGVVYEVTRDDYDTIVRTEGGGSAYRDVLTPCVPLPPAFGAPEQPPSPVPGPPRPFLAHTLYAPQQQPRPPPGRGRDRGSDGDDDDCRSRLRRWAAAGLARPVVRPGSGYAQPSPRYLGLIRRGAAEHGLPDDYQAYLAALRAYARTSCRQEVGRVLFLALWAPVLLVVMGLSQILASRSDNRDSKEEEGRGGAGAGAGGREGGNAPRWVSVLMAAVMNLMWMSYDSVFKPLFGDGERTEEEEHSRDGMARRRGGFLRRSRSGMRTDEETPLIGDWEK